MTTAERLSLTGKVTAIEPVQTPRQLLRPSIHDWILKQGYEHEDELFAAEQIPTTATWAEQRGYGKRYRGLRAEFNRYRHRYTADMTQAELARLERIADLLERFEERSPRNRRWQEENDALAAALEDPAFPERFWGTFYKITAEFKSPYTGETFSDEHWPYPEWGTPPEGSEIAWRYAGVDGEIYKYFEDPIRGFDIDLFGMTENAEPRLQLTAGEMR